MHSIIKVHLTQLCVSFMMTNVFATNVLNCRLFRFLFFWLIAEGISKEIKNISDVNMNVIYRNSNLSASHAKAPFKFIAA